MLLSILLAAVLALPGLPAQGQPPSRGPAAVSGRVVDAVTGRPLAGAIVIPAGSAVPISSANPLPARALTNGDGVFVLRGLRQGSVFLTAAMNGYANASYNQRRPRGSGQSLPVADGQQLSGIEIRMWRNSPL